jgi:hypothetical protein
MIRDVLTSIEGAHLFPLITLILFVVIFVGAGLWAWFANRDYLDYMRQLPLEDSELCIGEGEQDNG